MKKMNWTLTTCLTCLYLMVCMVGTNAQTPAFEWVKTDVPYGAIITDAAESIYISGGGGIAKVNPEGDTLWTRGLYSGWPLSISGVAVDKNDGSVCVTGYFSDTLDLDPGPGVQMAIASGGTDYSRNIFVLKLDASGDFVWAKSYAGSAGNVYDMGRSVAIDGLGDIYVSGFVRSDTVDFNMDQPGTTGLLARPEPWDYTAFFLKLDASGNFIWLKQVQNVIGGNVDNGFMEITTDTANNFYATLTLNNAQTDINPGPDTLMVDAYNTGCAVVFKLNTAGDCVWSKNFGGGGYGASALSNAIATDLQGNVYTTGLFTTYWVDFDPDTTVVYTIPNATGGSQVYISKLDPSGNFVWTKGLLGPSGAYNNSNGIAVDASSNVYTTGSFSGTADFDPDSVTQVLLTTFGNGVYSDVFVSKLDAGGNYVWAGNFGGGSSDGGYDITVSNLNKIYTVGSTVGIVDFNPSVAAADTFILDVGNYNSFLHKMNQCAPDSVSLTESACDTFILNSQTYTQTGTYTQIFSNSMACDSVITLNLTINHPTASELTDTGCNSYTLAGQTYTQSGTYLQTLTSAKGCDSVVTLHLTIKTINTDVTQDGAILSSMLTGATATYQWIDCDNGNVPVPGATTQTFTAATNGNYAVIVNSDDACSDTSVCYSVTSLGIHELGAGNIVSLYPNPTHNSLTISTQKEVHRATIKLLALTGQVLIQKQHLAGTRFQLDMSPYASGIYFVELSEDYKAIRVKIVKQ